MSDFEEERRQAEQARALDVHRPSGAMIHSDYLERRQEVIGVNRTDLDDILMFDGLSAGLSGAGLFFLSGALWLGLDKFSEQNEFTLTPVIIICAASVVLGCVLLGLGLLMWFRKRGRITRIFRETTVQRPP